MEQRPDPQNIRDLRLMYETCGKIDGNIEYKQLLGNEDYCEGAFVRMLMRVVPDTYMDTVRVVVEREKVTNYRKTSPMGCSYTPVKVIDWEHVYTFQEFKESPFYQMCIDVWGDRGGLITGLYWDTSLMDDHEAVDDDTRWTVYAHVYEHHRTWLGNWDKTGRIEAVDFSLDEDGNVEMGLSRYGKRECFYDGDVWTLADIIDEHEQMQEQLKKLKEHGIDLDDGTLSIKLWE